MTSQHPTLSDRYAQLDALIHNCRAMLAAAQERDLPIEAVLRLVERAQRYEVEIAIGLADLLAEIGYKIEHAGAA
jgi:hypothetical protein